MSNFLVVFVSISVLISPAFGRMASQPGLDANDVSHDDDVVKPYPELTSEAPAAPSMNMFMIVTKVLAMAMEWLNSIQEYIVENVVGTLVPWIFGVRVDKQLVRSAMGTVRTKAFDYVKGMSLLKDYRWVIDSVSMLV